MIASWLTFPCTLGKLRGLLTENVLSNKKIPELQSLRQRPSRQLTACMLRECQSSGGGHGAVLGAKRGQFPCCTLYEFMQKGFCRPDPEDLGQQLVSRLESLA